MKDIARDVGVSIITVSKVLHNHEDISEKTRKRVLDRAKELNYTPNIAARSLVTGRSYLVGLVVPDLLHTYFAQIAKSLSEALLRNGYGLLICSSEENPELEKRTLDRLLLRRLDALVIASGSTTSEIFEHIKKVGPPIVMVDRRFPDFDENFVGTDDEVVGAIATEHLVEIGCTKIAHLRGPETSPGTGRLSGYLKTLEKYKMSPLPGHISAPRMADVRSRESGQDQMKEMLRLPDRPDGVFAYNDSMAIGAMHEILNAGLRIPEDIAVIGSGNLHYDTELRVPLSSIDQQTEEIGEHTAHLTLSLIEAKSRPDTRSIIVQPKLIVRASTDLKRKRRR